MQNYPLVHTIHLISFSSQSVPFTQSARASIMQLCLQVSSKAKQAQKLWNLFLAEKVSRVPLKAFRTESWQLKFLNPLHQSWHVTDAALITIGLPKAVHVPFPTRKLLFTIIPIARECSISHAFTFQVLYNTPFPSSRESSPKNARSVKIYSFSCFHTLTYFLLRNIKRHLEEHL